jgi:type III secretory pathway component EscT
LGSCLEGDVVRHVIEAAAGCWLWFLLRRRLLFLLSRAANQLDLADAASQLHASGAIVLLILLDVDVVDDGKDLLTLDQILSQCISTFTPQASVNPL